MATVMVRAISSAKSARDALQLRFRVANIRYPLICPGVHLSGSFFSAIYRVRVRVRVSRVSRVSRVGRVRRV